MNPQVKKLHEKRRNVLAEIASLRAEIGSGEPTESDRANLASLDEIRVDLDGRIARLETLIADANRPENTKYGEGLQLTGMPAPRSYAPTVASRGETWARSMFRLADSQSGFGDMGDFLSCIQSGMLDSRLAIMATGQKEGIGSTGGFLVPEELAVSVLGPAYESSVCLQRCQVHPMQTEEKKVAGWDTSSASGGALFGGFTPAVLGEGDSMTAQTGQVRSVKLHARKVGLLAKSSNELIDDAASIPQLLQTGLSTAIGYTLDYFVLHGTGAGQPLGLLNAPSKITVDAETGQAADTIIYENLVKMFARLHPGCYSNAVWLCHPSTIPYLETMTITVGTSGAVVRLLTEGNGSPEMLHRPIIFTEKCNTVGTEGDVILTDLSQYALGMRKEITVEQSRHVYFASDETAWRAIVRFDGQPLWSAAYTPINGSTLSWCITLATR
jgi:HK97 family phage major capsid protein